MLPTFVLESRSRSAAGEILAAELPGVRVSLSSHVAPEIREYVRASTTVINAIIQPTVSKYLRELEEDLRATGIPGELLVMQSSGGVFTFQAARQSRCSWSSRGRRQVLSPPTSWGIISAIEK